MKGHLSSLALLVLLFGLVFPASGFNQDQLVESIVSYDKSLDSHCVVSRENVHVFWLRVAEAGRRVDESGGVEGLCQNIDDDINLTVSVQEILMGLITTGEYKHMSELGCDVVGLHGAVSQHLRQLNKLKTCAKSKDVDCESSLRILSGNAERSRVFIRSCLRVLS